MFPMAHKMVDRHINVIMRWFQGQVNVFCSHMMLSALGFASGQYHFTWATVTTEHPLNQSDLNVIFTGSRE